MEKIEKKIPGGFSKKQALLWAETGKGSTEKGAAVSGKGFSIKLISLIRLISKT